MPNIAIIGATGAVGDVFLRVAEERNFPVGDLKLLATARSAGKTLKFKSKNIIVEEVSKASLENSDIVFCSATSEASKEWGPLIREMGSVMIDDGSAFRMDRTVPLVVPEVNAADLSWHEGIISIPNCTTTPLALALHSMRSISEPIKVTASTYQAVTGSGTAAVLELTGQLEALTQEKVIPQPTVYPQQIAMNVLPQVDEFDEGNYTKEELKMRNETRKILHLPDLPITATCVRVPTMIGHAETIHVEFQESVDLQEIFSTLSKQEGISISESPHEYPTPLTAEGNDLTHIGRLRRDETVEDNKGIVFWCVSDNLRKGAATNALQIAEELLKRNLLRGNNA
ncbi:MAG: aspartate-semialdehyde dehydrogenase [SAR202 cluster bacterium]|nr:aspartate-semialdehyde dehydrogenase [SAR202 cluster bacterium]MCH2523572.1 aspartate-semialdehyde dehydrogenase [Dehalococcoidia bacterium]